MLSRFVRCSPSKRNSRDAAISSSPASSPAMRRVAGHERGQRGEHVECSPVRRGRRPRGPRPRRRRSRRSRAASSSTTCSRKVRSIDGRDQLGDDLVLAPLLHGLDLDLALRGGHDRGEVAHARDDHVAAGAQRAAERVRHHALVVRDREAHRYAAALVHERAAPRELADADDRALDEPRHDDRRPTSAGRVDLVAHDAQLGVGVARVVRADLRAEAVLQRRDDPATVGVVLGVRRRHQHEVEREADPVPADLDVALLEHVQEPDLDALGEVGQLVDREDPAVDPRHEAEGERPLVGEVAALGDLDRVDLTDQVRDRRVRRRELLAVAFAAVHPRDRRVVTELLDELDGMARDRVRTGRR